MFYVGQKVVCVDNSHAAQLTVGGIYTVLKTSGVSGDANFLLIDGRNDPGGWFKARFRPLTERKTDISIFTRMLTPTTVEREPAS